MRPSLPLILATLLSAAALAGCGLKNDLYLPPTAEAHDADDQSQKDEESEHAENSRT
ncbi:MAG: lipoprotein [Wenzhouxiangella sp.]|jgi:predicted small lipoprotein YifL|nr:lipoprotein [Wenzhouxiangella sp.]